MKRGETNNGRNIAQAVLKNQASRGRVEAIWRRIEEELPASGGVHAMRRRVKPLLWTAAAFAGGVVFGIELSSGPEALVAGAPRPSLQAEPASSTVVRGARQSEQPSNQAAELAALDKPSSGGERALGTGRGSRGRRASVEALGSVEATSAVLPEWQQFAERGDYEEAVKVIEANGGFEAELQSASAERLMLLGDVARATGNRKLAARALRLVVHDHAADPLAPLAAWSLGNMLEKGGDRAGAAEAFAMYRSLSPQGDFAEDALAHQARVAVEEGDLELATRLVAQYEKSFPDGRRAKEIREQLERLREHAPEKASPPDAGAELGKGDPEELGSGPAPPAQPAPSDPAHGEAEPSKPPQSDSP